MDNKLEILTLLNAITNIAINAKINVDKFNNLRQWAKTNNRQITKEELKSLADDAQSAIDSLD